MLHVAKGFVALLGVFVAVGACSAPTGAKPRDAGGAGAPAAAGQGGAAGAETPPSGASGGGAGASVTSTADAAIEAAGGGGGAPAASPDAALAADMAVGPALPKAALLFTRSRSPSGYLHESIAPAVAALTAALAARGITSTSSDDLALITPAGLARFGVVVLVSTTGAVFDTPGLEAQAALAGFVRAGGGLVAIHSATATAYDATTPYVPLLGGKFIDHPGGIRATTCQVAASGDPTTAGLPATFPWRDEIYTYRDRRADSQVVVTCLGTDGTTLLPISWHHAEGAGRVFNTALGHGSELYAETGLLVAKHLVPGILWALRLD